MKSRHFLQSLLASVLFAVSGCATEPSTSKGRILVLGATGQLGAGIARELVASGRPVTALVRPNSDRNRLQGLDIEYLTGDVTNDADVAAAFKGHRYSAIVIALRVMDNDIHFYEKALRPIARYAKSAGVGQIIHHGAVGAGSNLDKIPHEGWDRIPGIFDRLRDQGVGEQLIRSSGVPYTIIRNARIYPNNTPSTGKAILTEDDTVVTPMTRADLAIFTLRYLSDKACLGKTYHVKDPSLAWPPPGIGRP